MRAIFVAILVATTVGVVTAMAAASPSTTASVTAALLSHETPISKRAKAQVECRSVIAHQTIIECDTFTDNPSPVAKMVTFPTGARWVSRVAEAYRIAGCSYRINIDVGSTLALVYTGILNVCGKNWTREIGV